jgi:hypothetical protein
MGRFHVRDALFGLRAFSTMALNCFDNRGFELPMSLRFRIQSSPNYERDFIISRRHTRIEANR